ncbi:MAG: hypothetical protein ACAI25_07510 [Planctomycetota bacterium]
MARAGAGTTSRAGLLVLALAAQGCGVVAQIPSARVGLAAIATVVGADTVSTEYSPPGIATRAEGAYLTSCLELDAAKSVVDELPPGEIGVVLVDAMPEDVKLSRAFAGELARLGRTVVRLKPADLAKTAPRTVVWLLPRSGGLESVLGDEMTYLASVRILAIDGATRRPIFARTVERRGSRDRVSDILGVLDKK